MFEQEEQRDELLEKIEDLISRKRYAELRDLLLPLEAQDIAGLFMELDDKVPMVFRLLPKEQAAEVFVELDSEEQEVLIQSFSNTELKEVLDELYLDDAVDIVEEMPANVVKRILRHADPDVRKSINEILKYPDDCAGSIMTTEYVDLKATMTVEDALKRIRRTGPDKETINICYVIDEGRHLLGYLSIRTILLSEEDDVVGDIMDTHVISANTLDDQEDVAQTLNKYDFLALPIVDTENRLVGIVTVDDAMDVLQEEVTEDIEKMAAILPGDKPYLKTGVFETWRARTPWLMMLMLSATFTGMILTHFENSLAAVPILTSYIPMLSGTGGNSGTQASTAVIRALSLGEVRFSDLLRVVWKECRVALICGVCLAAANFVKMMVVDCWLLANPTVTPAVAAEAAELGADLIVAHHPVMNVRWHEREMQTLRDDTRLGGLLTYLVRHDLSAICMHTNLDAAEGGVNDQLAWALGLTDTIPLNEQKIGRIGTLSCEKPLEQFLHDVVKSLGCRGLRYRSGGRPVRRVAVGGGACGEYIPQALAQGCDTFVTSDLRYNDFLDTQGLNLIDAGHFPTEDVVCAEVVRRLQKAFPDIRVSKSAVHHDAVQYYMTEGE